MKIKKYKQGGESLMEIMDVVKSYFPNEANKILDIAGYKPPQAAKKLAKWYPESKITHFREDSIRIDKVSPAIKRIPNLEVVSSYRNLEDVYNLALAFFTLHELKKPKKSLDKTLRKMTTDGKFICVDYDLNWFSQLAKQNKWKLPLQKSNFSKYVFTEGNENVVMGMKAGKILPKGELNEDLVEEDCVYEHTKLGIAQYLNLFSDSGLKTLESMTYNIQTPWGEKPKCFLYIGEK